jgi:hypothetical protein
MQRRKERRAPKRKIKTPIMSPDRERFMAFHGLIQWTKGVVDQSERTKAAHNHLMQAIGDYLAPLNLHCQHHFFVISAYKLIEYRDWCRSFGLFKAVDFSEIDSFSKDDIRDLRNMREHIVEYFKGEGNAKDRWKVQTPGFGADASSVVGTIIGGRLDWVKFSEAAKRLLPALLSEPSQVVPFTFP